MPIRPWWLIVFKCLYAYWFFCLVVLLITEREALKSPTINVNSSLSPFSSVSILPQVFWNCDLGHTHLRGLWFPPEGMNDVSMQVPSQLSPDCSSETGCGAALLVLSLLIYSLLFLPSLTHTHSLIGSKSESAAAHCACPFYNWKMIKQTENCFWTLIIKSHISTLISWFTFYKS